MEGPGRVSNDKLTLCLSVSQPLPPYPTLHLPPSSDPGTCRPLCLEPAFSRPSHDPFPAPAGSGLSLAWTGVIVCTLQIFVSEWTPFTPSLSLPLSQSLCLTGPCWVAVFVYGRAARGLRVPGLDQGLCPLLCRCRVFPAAPLGQPLRCTEFPLPTRVVPEPRHSGPQPPPWAPADLISSPGDRFFHP